MFTEEQIQTELDQISEKIKQAQTLLNDLQQVELGSCAREVIYHQDKLKLYYYPSQDQQMESKPLLICYALINRPSILDLSKECSFIGGLLAQGQSVYLIDWGYPDQNDKDLALSDYINVQLKNCVQAVRQHSEHKKINLLGICQGGVFSLCFASLYPQMINRLITMGTPVDFHVEAMPMRIFIQQLELDKLICISGNIPGAWFPQFFLGLKPVEFTTTKYFDFIERLDSSATVEKFLKMEKWIYDSPDQAGCAFKEFVHCFYNENKFMTGKIKLGRRYVHMEKIAMPVLNIMASNDHIVPTSSSKALKKLINHEQYNEYYFPGGHIGIFVSSNAQVEVTAKISGWLSQ